MKLRVKRYQIAMSASGPFILNRYRIAISALRPFITQLQTWCCSAANDAEGQEETSPDSFRRGG